MGGYHHGPSGAADAEVRAGYESSAPGTWSEQTRRSGFATGSLWTGSGAPRVLESSSLTTRTLTLPGSASRSARLRAFYRMKYCLSPKPPATRR